MHEHPNPADAIVLQPISVANWRSCAALEVTAEQGDFAAPVTRYLALCAYDDSGWSPLAIEAAGRTVGFVMHAEDPADDSFWIGGLVVDASQQRKGYARAAVRQLIQRARSAGSSSVALSYQPANTAARVLYACLDFVETGEREDDEVVARLPLTDQTDRSTR